MKFRTAIVIVFLFIFIGLAIGGGILTLLAFGVGWLVNLVMRLEPFQATLITLLAMTAFGLLSERIWSAVLSVPPWIENDSEDGEEDKFEGVAPDDRCPCGSGRKYKNCHGAKSQRQK